MRGWLAANLFLLAILVATVGGIFVSTLLIALLHLEPFQERMACVAAAAVIIIGVGFLSRSLLGLLQRR